MNFGEILKKLRISRGEKQTDIASILKVSDRTVGLWERNESFPSIETVKALADHFKVSVDYLTGRVNESTFENNNDPLVTKDNRYRALGRILKESTQEDQERFYKMAALLLEKHPNERLFADAADGENDDTI